MWDNYYNKKVEITEKTYGGHGNSMMETETYNKTVGILTNVYSVSDGVYIELDGKILIALKYVYKIEIYN